MSFMSFIFILILVFIVLPIIAVIAIVDMYITKNKVKKNVVPTQTNVENDNMVDITQLGEVDLMHQLHIRRMDDFFKARYRGRLINWKASQDINLDWTGKHHIEVFTLNGGYEKRVVKEIDGKIQFVDEAAKPLPFYSDVWFEENYDGILKECQTNGKAERELPNIAEDKGKELYEKFMLTGNFSSCVTEDNKLIVKS